MASCKDLCNHRRQITQSLLIVKFLSNKFSTSCILKLKLALFFFTRHWEVDDCFLCAHCYFYILVYAAGSCVFSVLLHWSAFHLYAGYSRNDCRYAWCDKGNPRLVRFIEAVKPMYISVISWSRFHKNIVWLNFFNFVFETVKVVMMQTVFIFIHIPFFFLIFPFVHFFFFLSMKCN